MNTSRHIEGKARLAFTIGFAFVIAGIAMIIVGWTEEHLWQTITLQLSGVMFALAVGVSIFHMLRARKLSASTSFKFRMVRTITFFNLALGIFLYLIAFGLRYLSLAPLGQFFIWIGTGAMFIYLAAGSVRENLAYGSSWDKENPADSLAFLENDDTDQKPRRALETP